MFFKCAFWLYMIFYFYTGISVSRDTMEMRRAKQVLVERYLNEKGTYYKDIDAGFDINSWLEPENQDNNNLELPLMKTGRKYLISFKCIAGYSKFDSAVFFRWLPPGYEEKLLLIKKFGGPGE